MEEEWKREGGEMGDDGVGVEEEEDKEEDGGGWRRRMEGRKGRDMEEKEQKEEGVKERELRHGTAVVGNISGESASASACEGL
eukprot:3941776-Rhodomonas_salina.1